MRKKQQQTFERKYKEKGFEESHVGWWKRQPMFSRHMTNKSNYKLIVNYSHFSIKVYTHSIHSHFSEVRGKALPSQNAERIYPANKSTSNLENSC